MSQRARSLVQQVIAGSLCAGIWLASPGSAQAAGELQLTEVIADRAVLEQGRGAVSVSFRVSDRADVSVKIFDARDELVWSHTVASLPKGKHAVAWNGANSDGQAVPPEAYYYVVETHASDKSVAHDLTDATGGESALLEKLVYNPDTRQVSFLAPHTGRYTLRAGISQAFAVNTLINNRVIEQGEHAIEWDGYDASRVFTVAEHPKLLLSGFGHRTSSNLILVKARNGDADLTRTVKWGARDSAAEQRPRNRHQRQGADPGFHRAVDMQRDATLKVVLPAAIKKGPDGVPILTGKTPIRIELAPDDALVMESQRGEIVFFWNNQLIYDNEVSYYPYTYQWSPPVLDGRRHLLTALVAGFGGNIALGTIEIQLGEALK